MSGLLTQANWRTFRIGFNLTAGVLALVLAALLLVILAGITFDSLAGDDDRAIAGPAISAVPLEFPADSSHGLVTGESKRKQGLSLFGWDLTDSTHVVSVGYILPEGCNATADNRMVAEGPCAGIPAEGELWGRGNLPDGATTVTIAIEVSGACTRRLVHGDRWPSPYEECR